MKKFHIILLFLSMIWNFSFAQDYINYTEKDGLASNFVYKMTQDNEGFLWFITDKGISKFDGKTFKNFTTKEGLPNNDIFYIRITPNNRVWYFTRSDRLGYIENDSVFSFKSSDGNMLNPNGGINQSGNDLTILGHQHNYQFTDTIWQATPSNKIKYKFINKDILFVGGNTVSDRLETTHGKLLYTFKKRRSLSFRNEQINDSLFARWDDSFYEIINLNKLSVTYAKVNSSKPSPKLYTTLWFHFVNEQLQLCENQWVLDFDEKLNQKSIRYVPKKLKSTFNFRDKDGFIWAATSEKGVYKLPINYDSIETYFEGKRINGIETFESDIYVAVAGEGIYKISDGRTRFLFDHQGNYYNATQLKDKIFHNLNDYSILEKNGTFKKVYPKGGNFLKHLIVFKNNYFSEGFSSLFMYDQKFNRVKGYEDHSNYEGLFTQNDSLFSFSYKNMLYYDEAKDVFSEYNNKHIQKKLLTVEAFHNKTYIGTEGDGVYVFSESKLKKLIEDDIFIINDISIENENSIWAVSEGALLHYYKDESNTFSVKKYNQINGFPTENLTKVLIKDSKLYLGSTTGLSVINIDAINETVHFIPYVKSISVNGKKQRKDSLVLDYNPNLKLNVKFGSINFFDSNNASFQYQLSPIQNSWTTTESGEVNLFDLQPNNYTLALKVNHNDTHKIITVPITIIPKWWQTKLIWLLYWAIAVVVLMVFIFFVFRHFREKLLRERKLAQLELNALRSQMNPHFVHNSLNAIQYYIQRHEVELSENYLAKFSKLIRLFFEYSRKRNITIKEEVNLLEQYLQVEKLRFEDKLNFDILIDDAIDVEEQIIPSMILQPIVENAVNHGLFHKDEKGKILINFKYINASIFKVIIQDDGIGINKAKEIYKSSSRNYQSKSSAVLQERLELLSLSKDWNISYSIEDRSVLENNSGTNVILYFNQNHEI